MLCPLNVVKKKEKQWACKPGSVPAEAGACHLSTTALSRRLYRSTLQLGRAALSRPCALRGGRSRRIAGLHELSSSGVHSTHVAMRLVSSYLAFSPLPPCGGGRSLLHVLALADFYPLGSGVPYAARTFLLPATRRAQTSGKPSHCFSHVFAAAKVGINFQL